MIRGVVVLVALVGCGRRGFDTPSGCVLQISAGAFHTCALGSDGTIRCWGSSSLGELGDGTFGTSPLPVAVTESVGAAPFEDATQISMGAESTSCARRSDGTAWCWGWNIAGQLGDGTQVNSPSPVQVMAAPGVPLVDVVEIAVGEYHTCARKLDDTLWCWGDNTYGQLGTGLVPAQSGTPLQPLIDAVTPLVGVQGVVLGAHHTVAWTLGGQVYTWGWNVSGQLGIGSYVDTPYATIVTISRVVSASAGCCHTCVATETGHAYCFGRNVNGELGDGTLTSHNTPEPVLEAANGPPFLVSRIVAGDSHTCASRDDGSVWCWGDNSNGELGTGRPETEVPTPGLVTLEAAATDLAAGNNHVCAALGDGMSCWGLNDAGQLGNGGFTTSAVPARVEIDCP